MKIFQLNFLSFKFLRLECEAHGARGVKPKFIQFLFLSSQTLILLFYLFYKTLVLFST